MILYGFLFIYLSGVVLDAIVFSGFNSRAVYIITSDPEAVKNKIYSVLERGVTEIYSRGGYRQEDKKMLVCVMSNNEFYKMKTLILEIDKRAFIFVARVSEVHGEGFTYDSPEQVENEDQIVSYRLIKGNVLDQKTYKTLMTDVNNTVYYNKALHFIDFKPRTKKEINEYLTKFQLDESTINKIIKKLEKIGFIDDERYANRYTEELIRKGKGKKAIYNLLIKKGIEQDLINENLSKYEKDDEFANALRIAEKLVKPESDYPIKKQKMQLIEKLLREGYGQDAINYAMSNITFTDNSQERLIKEYEKLQDKNIEKEKIIARLLAKGYEYSDIKRILK